MKNRLLLFVTLMTSLSFIVAFLMTDNVEAKVTYSCPAGQTMGRDVLNADARYCYTPSCPSGQSKGIPTSANDNKDPNKCYELDASTNKHYERGDVAGPTDVRHGEVRMTSSDGLKCPQGSYRGGLLHTNMDEGKCYTCSGPRCSELRGQPLVPVHYQACLVTDKTCIAEQRRTQDEYIRSIENSAPRGFKVPKNKEGLAYSASAVKYCDYYSKMNWIQHYEASYLTRACKVGYEVGFGKGDICTRQYLFGHDATHRPVPTRATDALRGYADRLRLSEKNLLISDAIKACQDGWIQYSVDYWYCEGDGGCQDGLRMEKSRVIDPGPRPTKTSYVDEDGNVIETYNAVATSQNCGSVQTAFFTCGFGRGVQNSTLWQVIQMILNIMIGLVGIAAVGGLVYGAIRYSSAGDNASQVEQAKTIIKNVIIGLVLFLVMWATLQYMIPGGIFSSS